jgi:hypothetical protein
MAILKAIRKAIIHMIADAESSGTLPTGTVNAISLKRESAKTTEVIAEAIISTNTTGIGTAIMTDATGMGTAITTDATGMGTAMMTGETNTGIAALTNNGIADVASFMLRCSGAFVVS